MKALLILVLSCLLFLPAAVRADDETVGERFVAVYGLMLDGDARAQAGQAAAAREKYAEAQKQLKKLRVDYPSWNVRAVKYRLDYLAARLAAAPASVAPAFTPPNPAEPVEMKLKWETGKRYLQRVEMNQVMEIKPPGSSQTMKQETKQTQDIAISVTKDRDGGGHELQMEITAMVMNMKMGGATLMNFDSKKPATDDTVNPAAPVFRNLIGAHISLITDASGRIESVEGFQEFMDRVTGGSPPEAAAMLKSFLSEDSMKEMADAGRGLPDKAVKIGDSWPVKVAVPMGPLGRRIMDKKFVFKSWELHDKHKCVVLEHTGDISMTSDSGSSEIGGMTMAIDQGKTTGTTWFDPALGMACETSFKQDITFKVNVQGKSMNTPMHQYVDTKLVEISDIPR
jgi:hypothetical protein